VTTATSRWEWGKVSPPSWQPAVEGVNESVHRPTQTRVLSYQHEESGLYVGVLVNREHLFSVHVTGKTREDRDEQVQQLVDRWTKED
jgi:hypothetical protein